MDCLLKRQRGHGGGSNISAPDLMGSKIGWMSGRSMRSHRPDITVGILSRGWKGRRGIILQEPLREFCNHRGVYFYEKEILYIHKSGSFIGVIRSVLYSDNI